MTSEVTQADVSATFESDPQVDNSLSGRLARANSILRELEKILGFEFDGPCPICSGIEGCSHSLRERVEAARLTEERDALVETMKTIAKSSMDSVTRHEARSSLAKVKGSPDAR